MTKTTNIDAALANLKAAESAHAACLRWNRATNRMESLVSDAELAAKYAAVQSAEQAYAKVCR